jgi:xylulokinase
VASFMACGAVQEGIGVDVAGTASVFAATTSSFRADTDARMLGCGRAAQPGLWHPYAYINGGGMNLQWFCRELANAGRDSGKGLLSLANLDKLAAALEPRDDLPWFVPHLGGRVCPAQPDLRGAWVGLSWDHGLGHLYRAVLEGVALEYALYQQGLRRLYGDSQIRELRVTGGGETSDLWNAIKADVLQTPLRRVARPEGAPLGAAMLAGWGVGLLAGLPQAARQWIPLGPVVRPRKPKADFYAQRLSRYESLLKLLDPIEC